MMAGDDDVPTVAILARSWGGSDEAGWALRQVAGALACVASVHVLTPRGRRPGNHPDGVFLVHELASAPDPALEARRDVLVAAFEEAEPFSGLADSERRDGIVPIDLRSDASIRSIQALVMDELAACWDPASALLERLAPDVVVVADYRQAGAMRAVESLSSATPVVVVPLGTDLGAMVFPAFSTLFERAGSALVFTETEAGALEGSYRELAAHHVGLPMAANQSVLREPNTYTGEEDYAVVLTGVREASPEWPSVLGRLLEARFAGRKLALVTSDSFTVMDEGIHKRPPGTVKGSDFLRLMAWADVTVDLRPGRLFARRCLESLLYGTPVVVPATSRAQEHAKAGGGLWYEDPSDLLRFVDALLSSELGRQLGIQGKLYAESRYGSTDNFIDNVVAASGLRPATARATSAKT